MQPAAWQSAVFNLQPGITPPTRAQRTQLLLLQSGDMAAGGDCVPAIASLAARPCRGAPAALQGVVLNGDPQSRYWGNINLSFAYMEGESLLMGLKVCMPQRAAGFI